MRSARCGEPRGLPKTQAHAGHLVWPRVGADDESLVQLLLRDVQAVEAGQLLFNLHVHGGWQSQAVPTQWQGHKNLWQVVQLAVPCRSPGC